jgi:hypothetical protein
VCWSVSLLLLLRTMPERLSPMRRTLVLTAAALFPGLPWALGVYPVSMGVLGAVLAGFALARGRPWLAGAFAIGMLAAHSAGLAMTAGVICAALTLPGEARERLQRTVRLALLPIAYLIAQAAYFQVSLGHWNANLLTQTSYGNKLTSPLTTVATRLGSLGFSSAAIRARTIWPPLQELALLAVLLLAAAGLPRLWRKVDVDLAARTSFVLAVGGIVTYVGVSLTGPYVSGWRTAAFSMPATAGLAHLPRQTLTVAVAVLAVIGIGMTAAFISFRLP